MGFYGFVHSKPDLGVWISICCRVEDLKITPQNTTVLSGEDVELQWQPVGWLVILIGILTFRG
jgi:hypothetical protein